MAKTEKTKIRRRQRAKAEKQRYISQANNTLIDDYGFEKNLNEDFCLKVVESHIQKQSYRIALAAVLVAALHHPITVRGMMYQLVSKSIFPSTDKAYYRQTDYWAVKLRREGFIPYDWIVDNIRDTRKPQSWSGLRDFVEEIQQAYRLDFWSRLPEYVCVICEKDAVAGTLEEVIVEFDVPLHPLRGYISESFVYEIAQDWKSIEKPISVYYLGDHDPRGYDIERDIRQKVTAFSGRRPHWRRLGISPEQVERFNIIKLDVKKSDSLAKQFISEHGDWAAELDALRPDYMRSLLRNAIESHIDVEH